MTSKDFRKIILGMKDTIETSHMNHPDFRVNGRIFATLKHDELSGMVALTPEQQREFIDENPKAFSPEAGAWGRNGCTKVLLSFVDEDALGRAATLARQNAVNKGPSKSVRKRKPR
jgi:hypothetical protein